MSCKEIPDNAAYTPVPAGQTQDLANLLADAFPSNPVSLLGEWEETLGLPNPYAGIQTISQRQQQVLQKFANDGGQTVNYFLSVINSLGFTGATITEYTPFAVGDTVNMPVLGAGWAFAWLITAPNLSVSYLTVGDTVNTALYEIIGAAQLEYVIDEYAPAHTVPLFAVA